MKGFGFGRGKAGGGVGMWLRVLKIVSLGMEAMFGIGSWYFGWGGGDGLHVVNWCIFVVSVQAYLDSVYCAAVLVSSGVGLLLRKSC